MLYSSNVDKCELINSLPPENKPSLTIFWKNVLLHQRHGNMTGLKVLLSPLLQDSGRIKEFSSKCLFFITVSTGEEQNGLHRDEQQILCLLQAIRSVTMRTTSKSWVTVILILSQNNTFLRLKLQKWLNQNIFFLSKKIGGFSPPELVVYL